MRTIKFRCWRPSTEKMYPVLELSEYAHNLFLDSDIQMQFTGLKDSQGVDIYEGDILAVNGKPIYRVEWSDHMAMFNLVDTDGEGHMDNFDACEVVGNIYENPDLLKQTNNIKEK